MSPDNNRRMATAPGNAASRGALLTAQTLSLRRFFRYPAVARSFVLPALIEEGRGEGRRQKRSRGCPLLSGRPRLTVRPSSLKGRP